MRGLKLILVIFLLLAVGTALFAAESDFFVKTVPITKVYLYNEGFRILYLKSSLDFGVFYVPMDWFSTSANSKAEVVYDTNPAFPYFSIFWENGEFHHIRLYLEENRDAESWGDKPLTEEILSRFENTETLDPDF
mgnify:CR=1 FL=1